MVIATMSTQVLAFSNIAAFATLQFIVALTFMIGASPNLSNNFLSVAIYITWLARFSGHFVDSILEGGVVFIININCFIFCQSNRLQI